MSYITYYFSASSRQELVDGFLQTAQEEGLDPSALVEQDESGQYHIDTSIAVFFGAGEWWEVEPTESAAGVLGTEALVNIRTDDPALQAFFEAVPVGTTRNGVERVDPTTPTYPFV